MTASGREWLRDLDEIEHFGGLQISKRFLNEADWPDPDDTWC